MLFMRLLIRIYFCILLYSLLSIFNIINKNKSNKNGYLLRVYLIFIVKFLKKLMDEFLFYFRFSVEVVDFCL